MRAARWIQIAAATLSLAGVLFVAGIELTDPSPGPLAAPHLRIAELAGSAGCARCHGEANGAAETCMACHAAIAADVKAKRGLHGSMAEARCGSCHVEHHGDLAPQVAAGIFAKAGVADALAYDHRGLDLGLGGKHATLRCEACHAHAWSQPLPAGSKRFKGAPRDCAGCHKDPHRGELGQDCARCHGQDRPFVELAGFQHDARFPLTDRHARVACRACHDQAKGSALESLLALKPGTAQVRACADCHDDVHRSGKALPLASTGDCARCHDARGFQRSFGPAEHERLGVRLAGVHARADCRGCHTATSAPAKRDLQRCADCHASPHTDSFLAGITARRELATERACAACHTPDEAWQKGQLVPADHAASGFALAAPHDRLACSACHSPQARHPGQARGDAAWRRRLRQPDDCAACHADPHQGEFAGQSCLACHTRTEFRPVAFGAEQHARSRLPLEGAHLAVACDACHILVHPGGARRFRGTPETCEACHSDPHGNAFVRLPATVGGRSGCARCHDTTAFDRAKLTAEQHAAYTGYRLVGKHATAACAACHLPSPQPAAGGRRFGHAKTGCADCHADPHLGQFASGGRTDCRRCHDAAARFHDLRFDHQRDSRFGLDRDHAKLACSACHRPWPLPGGGSVVRYKPLGTQCADCHDARRGHDDRDGRGRGRGGRDDRSDKDDDRKRR
jgi:hypothetical protein